MAWRPVKRKNQGRFIFVRSAARSREHGTKMSKQDAKGRSQSAPMAVKKVDIAAARYPRRFWLAFWALADEQRVHLIVHEMNHYVWRGPVDELRRPVFPARDGLLLARNAAWAYEGRRLGQRKALAPACDHPLCIRPEHQRVVRRAVP